MKTGTKAERDTNMHETYTHAYQNYFVLLLLRERETYRHTQHTRTYMCIYANIDKCTHRYIYRHIYRNGLRCRTREKRRE